MRFKITIDIEPEQVIGLFQLYLYSLNTRKKCRSSFIIYIRGQLEQFGSGEGLLGAMEEYEKLSKEDMELLHKWKML